MIIGKLIKPCKIVIFEQDNDGGEIESFSLLKLSFNEALKLCLISKEPEFMLDNSVVLKYSGNDEIHNLWKELAVEHQKIKPSNFIDVSREFKTDITGTSCLIRDPKKHIIRIAKRDGDDKTTINRLCIDNEIRERFFNDCKICTLYKTLGKFAIDTKDITVYTYWSKYMNTSFIEQCKRLIKNK